MNSEFSKEVKNCFHRLMSQHFPQFEKTDSRGFGGLTYRSKVGDIFVFVRLQLAQRADSFTFELAASPEGSFPFDIIGTGPFRLVLRKYIRTRFHRLLPNPPKMDIWWDLNESRKPDLDAILQSQSPEQVAIDKQQIPMIVAEAAQQLFDILPAYMDEVSVIYQRAKGTDD